MNVHDLELKISKLLRTGVVIAGVVISIGWIWGVMVNNDDLFQFTQYRSESLVDSVRAAMQSGNIAVLITYFGLALLVCLPAMRVLLTGILFLTLKETILGWVALAVFTVLTASFLLGANI